MSIESSLDPDWLSVPEAAELLGLEFRALRNMIRDGELISVRVPGLDGPRIPSAFLVRGDGTAGGSRLVDGLKGSVTQLRDSGMADDELVAWLLAPHDELGLAPALALAAGQKHAVRRAALSLAY